VGGAVLGERQQVVDQRFLRFRAQHRGAYLEVAQQGFADWFGHRDIGEALLEAFVPIATAKVRCRLPGSRTAAGAGWPAAPGRPAATTAGSSSPTAQHRTRRSPP